MPQRAKDGKSGRGSSRQPVASWVVSAGPGPILSAIASL